MKQWVMLVTLATALPGLCLANNGLETAPIEPEQRGCSSIVCKNVIEPQRVSKAPAFQERAHNEMLDAVGSILFVAGEMGLAENLQEAPPEKSVFD
ncbi:hypothetical protein [Enterovibrio norvegicus]|uniref:hypothetical protein n=1 Tax=Enterovibrio norvegicus TaxID=188144 RepID=UPI00355296FC